MPELVTARDQEIIVIFSSGNHSVMVASTMQQLGYSKPTFLKTGLKGWYDYDQARVDSNEDEVDVEIGEVFLSPEVKPEQTAPK
jgi:hypothetical protein